MSTKNNISYRNSDSPESTLKVNYKYKEGTKIIELNKNQNPKNPIFSSLNNNKSINKSNILREQHFNSYSNENMDFFRLDYLKECDRNHFHNKYMNNLTPINRNENFKKIKENREKIKYLDSLKRNFLLKKENNKDFFKDNLYTSENIIKNNFFKRIDNRFNNNQNNLSVDIDNSYENYNYNKNNNNKTINNDINIYKNISIEAHPMKYSGAYLSNINDYSIKENQEINPYNKSNLDKNISRRSILSKQSHLFCKDVINNDMPALFYKIYDYNINNNGFKRQNNIFSNFMQLSNKPGNYISRGPGEIANTPKNNLTPPKRISYNDKYYSFSSKK